MDWSYPTALTSAYICQTTRREPTINCSCPDDYDEVFTAAAARATAERFQHRGLGPSEHAIVAGLREHGAPQMSVLEVGGGVGDLQVALLEDGVAATTINVELSSTWELAAADLLRDRHLTEKVTRLEGDFVDLAGHLPTADAVILHRVVCCYHDWHRLLGAAAAKAERFLAFTFPRSWTKSLLGFENLYHRIRRRRFRAYVHPPEEMLALLSASGFVPVSDYRTVFWRTAVLARTRAV